MCFAGDLVRWFQLLCLTGQLARAELKTLRWRLWHAPARLVRHARQDVVRILDGWPDAQAILAAHARITALTLTVRIAVVARLSVLGCCR